MPGVQDETSDDRAAEIEAARAKLRAATSSASLHEACMVLLALSDDPLDRLLARAFLDQDTD